jgi:hypothetical protein
MEEGKVVLWLNNKVIPMIKCCNSFSTPMNHMCLYNTSCLFTQDVVHVTGRHCMINDPLSDITNNTNRFAMFRKFTG